MSAQGAPLDETDVLNSPFTGVEKYHLENISIAPPKMVLTEKEIADNKIPRERRTFCAHKWLDLARCFDSTPFYRRWKCNGAKHDFEECEYMLYLRRKKIFRLLKANPDDPELNMPEGYKDLTVPDTSYTR